ncbi:MAG: Uma2 family endonuclease [Chloroflexaceae bacterium]|nr:Uma2 family endonuclease [Chloroflexaceae bacterium]
MTTTEIAVQPTHAADDRLPMSYEEYVAWEHEGSLAEWVDGEVIVFMPPLDRHQRVVLFLCSLLEFFVKIHKLGRVRTAPSGMRAIPGGSVREPDVLFLATEHLECLTERGLEGPADMVIEVVSDDSVSRDRSDKFYEYQEAGIREYWIIDPRPGKERTDFYVLDANARYQAVVPESNVYHSTVLPGLRLNLAWLWADDPDPLAALAESVGAAALAAALRQGE